MWHKKNPQITPQAKIGLSLSSSYKEMKMEKNIKYFFL